MPVCVAIPKERKELERRVALVPSMVTKLKSLGVDILLETGAGVSSFFPDELYQEVAFSEDLALYSQADIVLKVQMPTIEEISAMKAGSILICFAAVHLHSQEVVVLRDQKVTCYAVELIPRISRAQAMDALSSQASVAGYKGGLMAASLTGRFFPMLTTAAGTIRPSKALIIGAGVAGLQAIATCRRLGAMVESYDVRPATKEQVESLGAKFVELDVNAESEGGYARELTEEEKQQQTELVAKHVSAANVVITTAAIPGRPSPKLISKEMVEAMMPGSVVIDLAAEGGGNCELTEPGKEINHAGVIVYGPLNVPSMLPIDASEMYAKNLFNLLGLMIKDGTVSLDWEDEIIASAVTHDGEILHAATKQTIEGEAS
jgi:H+-translocating NAD(P) transhydrogenase subunit alpha